MKSLLSPVLAVVLGALSLTNAYAAALSYDQWLKDRGSLERALVEPPQGDNELKVALRAMCRSFQDVRRPKALEIQVLKPMRASGQDMDLLWIAPACGIGQLPSGVRIPVTHMVVENPTDRLDALGSLRKHYLEERQRPDIWKEIVNSKDTRGYTALDTMELLVRKGDPLPEEAPGVARYVAFLCDNGGSYAHYANSCNAAALPQVRQDLEAQARRGDAGAQWKLAEMYRYGTGGPKDARRAFDYYASAADKLGADRQRELAGLYQLGINGEGIDEAAAARWFLRAGDFVRVGDIYKTGGTNVTRNMAQALIWYRRAHDEGEFSGTTRVADAYREQRDEPNAFRWIKTAAESKGADEHQRSTYRLLLSQYYFQGIGTSSDAAAAAYWQREVLLHMATRKRWYDYIDSGSVPYIANFERLARDGNVHAQYLMAAYWDRDYPVSDYSAAATWYTLAAQQGDAEAQYRLGGMYERGQGIGQNTLLAKQWYRKAVAQGHAKALSSLNALN